MKPNHKKLNYQWKYELEKLLSTKGDRNKSVEGEISPENSSTQSNSHMRGLNSFLPAWSLNKDKDPVEAEWKREI